MAGGFKWEGYMTSEETNYLPEKKPDTYARDLSIQWLG